VPEPIVDLKFFKIPAFVNTLLNNFIVFMGMMGGVFLIPIFAQTFLGYDATQSGYLFIPMAAALMLAAPIGGALTGRVKPKYVIAASTFVAGVGIYLFSYLDPRSTAMNITIPLSIMAFGLGFGMSQRTNVIASVVPTEEIGVASSILALARNIAGAFGIALFGTILTNTINSKVLNIASHSSLSQFDPKSYQTFVGLIILKAQVASYAYVFLIASILVFIGSITAFWIRVDEERTDVHIMVE
jgi:MFS family permease